MNHSHNAPSPSHAEHHEAAHAPEPDFLQHVQNLETIAAHGLETSRGTEAYEFRAGIEIEFLVHDPTLWRERLERWSPSEDQHAYLTGRIRNQEQINGTFTHDPERLAHYREQAREMVRSLPAANDAEEEKRQKWLGEIDDFDVPEIINFRLYNEFSRPTLGNTTPPGGTLAELDDFSERQGWLEFRFGTSRLQAGYYDDRDMNEMRLTPAPPSDVLRRRETILKRAADIANEMGVLLETDERMEHVNLSAYTRDKNGDMRPAFGNGAARRERTLAAASGMAAAFQDGLLLHAKHMAWDYMFDPVHGNYQLKFGPVRETVRIVGDRVEYRGGEHSTPLVMSALMAGALYGLEEGVAGLAEHGYVTLEVRNTYQVHDEPGYTKEADLMIKRAFEEAEEAEDGSFTLGAGWNMVSGDEVYEQLMDTSAQGVRGFDFFNDLVFAAVRLDPAGHPRVTAETLALAYAREGDHRREYLAPLVGDDLEALAHRLNARLAKVRLSKSKAIMGTVKFGVEGREAALARVAQSPIADLAYQGRAADTAAWLRAGIHGPKY